jgi:hypothetical protein
MKDGRMEGWKVGMGLAILTACAPSNVPTVHPSAPWGPHNRALISDFSDVLALAASPWFVFAATTHGLVIYDRAARRFRTPVTTLDGYPSGRVRRAFADASGNAVWLDLGTGFGYARFDLDGRSWTSGALPSNGSQETLTVESALAHAPIADAMRAAILTDARLRTYQFTAAATTPERPEIFFGTNGLGLVRVDKQTGEWEVLTFGLPTPAVGAVATTTGGVWAATSLRPGAARRGVTFVAGDLSTMRSSEGGRAALGFTFRSARRLLAVGNQLWLATEQGVLRIDSSTFQSQLWDLPDATALAPAPNGVWAGTTRGLSLISGEQVVDVGSSGVGLAVTSLLAVGDTLWVGTNAGLGHVLPGATAITTPPELAADRPGLRVTVYALARLQDTIAMVTERELLWRDPASRGWTAVSVPLSLGVPTALAAARDGWWVGGTRGLARVELPSGLFHVHSVPFDIPAAVRDLAIDRDFLWAATDSGLVRIQ